ncbi:MAG: family N-acetyltransferase [Verrucomicrobiaceae bacterium]|nr:family N-acetyltransferase [Verrucomicrobiaceae bacterium]
MPELSSNTQNSHLVEIASTGDNQRVHASDNDKKNVASPSLNTFVTNDLHVLPTQHDSWVSPAEKYLIPEQRIAIFTINTPEVGQYDIKLARTGRYIKRLGIIGAAETGEPADFNCLTQIELAQLAKQLAAQPLATQLPRVPVASATIAALKNAFARRGIVVVREALGTPSIALDASWREPLLKFNAGRRSDIRRAQRHAHKLGGIHFEVYEKLDHKELDRLLNEAYSVEAKGWKGEARSALATNPKLGTFFRAYAHAAMRAGIFRLIFMRIDGRAVGMQIAIEWQHSLWLMKIGYDANYSRCSPGNLLLLYSIGYAAQRGLRSYEFFGDPAPWINKWAASLKPHVIVRAYPISIQSGMALLQDIYIFSKMRVLRWWQKSVASIIALNLIDNFFQASLISC